MQGWPGIRWVFNGQSYIVGVEKPTGQATDVKTLWKGEDPCFLTWLDTAEREDRAGEDLREEREQPSAPFITLSNEKNI